MAGPFGLEFYVGVPLRTHDGHVLGMLVLHGHAAARRRRRSELRFLETLAAIVMDEIELRRSASQISRLSEALAEACTDLERRASFDPLTGVLARSAMLERSAALVARALAGAKGVALLMLDIDRFKAINDGHGHAAGDRVLKEVAGADGGELPRRRPARPGRRRGVPRGLRRRDRRRGGGDRRAAARGGGADAGDDRRRAGAGGDGQRRAARRSAPEAAAPALSEAMSRADAALYRGQGGGAEPDRAPGEAAGRPPRPLGSGGADRRRAHLVGDVVLVLGEVLARTSRRASRPGRRRRRGRPRSRAGRGARRRRPGTSTGTSKPKIGSRAERARAPSEPSSAAVSSARVAAIGMRRPVAVGAAGPAGVDQPAGGAGAGDAVAQQRAVDLGPARHERRAEAGGEGRLRLGDAALGAGDLGGEAGEEVVHRLRRASAARSAAARRRRRRSA